MVQSGFELRVFNPQISVFSLFTKSIPSAQWQKTPEKEQREASTTHGWIIKYVYLINLILKSVSTHSSKYVTKYFS